MEVEAVGQRGDPYTPRQMRNGFVQPTGFVRGDARMERLLSLTRHIGSHRGTRAGAQASIDRRDHLGDFERLFDEVVDAARLLEILRVAPATINSADHD